ncbi:hypothetical protein HYPSUDRAFT_57924 [Hypholoma sublateritium FD-334 SS-4]|uniref:Intradiol ring-cleavage dioxygenases domain-containing protein n=1 Tax=Hypholoma sublateritium (strain FD-334 SS-4) TaxID=945553 RepID=A0A0D2ND70_HYPSF|nr:hypothetical protein HYPSUDRAFT_57924 [Hypholoma sublateritium FD-334 SS-4]
MRVSATLSLGLLSFVLVAVGHPGSHDEHDVLARREFLAHAKRSIADCADRIEARGIEARAISRRAMLADTLRSRRGLPGRRALSKRDFASVLATEHESNRTDLTSTSQGVDVFTGDLACVLQPEVTIGPYWVSAELVRTDLRDGEEGIPYFSEYQIIDVTTCEPIPNVYVDTWHANSTGVYGGIVAGGNGDITDESNINATHGRGLALTDADGVAYFETIFPGHYTGRTPHIHVFFDQALISAVEENSPYAENTQTLTLNSEDGIMGEEAAAMDPVVQYVWLGEQPSDGILGWITIGIDPTADYVTSAAATWTENGGVTNPNAGGGGPGGPPGGPGGPPPPHTTRA